MNELSRCGCWTIVAGYSSMYMCKCNGVVKGHSDKHHCNDPIKYEWDNPEGNKGIKEYFDIFNKHAEEFAE